MITLQRTNAQNPDFIELVQQLDAYLTITDGDEHDFYDQYNKLDNIKYVIVAYEDGKAVGCGAIKAFDKNTMEIKRMFTTPESRGKGIATQILKELEKWAAEMNYQRCILETGIRQIEAVRLYDKSDYQRTANYGQYIGVQNSVCFEKKLLS